jgi:hypothetical protein
MPGRSTFSRRRLPRWLRVILAFQILVLASLGFAYLLTLGAPSWWREVKADSQTTTTAEQVENGVVTQLSMVRPADPQAKQGYQSEQWSVSLSADDADAWLGTRLKQWIENQGGHWPEQLSGAQVEFASGVIKAGVRLEGGRVVFVEVTPEVRADGSLWLLPRAMGAGSMPLPTFLVLQEVHEGVVQRLPAGSARRTQAEEALDVLGGKRPALRDAVVKLDDGRRVRLVKVTPVAGRLEITCRTEKN